MILEILHMPNDAKITFQGEWADGHDFLFNTTQKDPSLVWGSEADFLFSTPETKHPSLVWGPEALASPYSTDKPLRK